MSNYRWYCFLCFFLSITFFSCTIEKKEKKREIKEEKQEASVLIKEKKFESKSLLPKSIKNSKELTNGLKIKWFTRGKGDIIKKEDVVKIDYQVLLEDGTFIDGNKLLNRDFLPFLVGYGLQTKGWDIAFTYLHVGDFVEVFIPSKLARGEKGIKRLVPPNANNILRVRVLDKIDPKSQMDGVKVWLLEENKNEKKLFDSKNSIEFHYFVGTPSNPKYDFSYSRAEPFKMKMDDRGVLKGLKIGLKNAKRSDKIWIVVPPELGYGEEGYLDLVKPNEKIFYDIFVMDVN
jgi:FKBP-type peptidyl-prolyl cis-trans isomerase